jgi:hypothetical protein
MRCLHSILSSFFLLGLLSTVAAAADVAAAPPSRLRTGAAVTSTNNATSTTNTTIIKKTGALEWAGDAMQATAPPTEAPITAAAPLGSQGESLTTEDTPATLPFASGVVSQPFLEKNKEEKENKNE